MPFSDAEVIEASRESANVGQLASAGDLRPVWPCFPLPTSLGEDPFEPGLDLAFGLAQEVICWFQR